jgi:hypothetical protein
MPKGNHVFNAFDKVIANSYAQVIETFVPDLTRDLDAVGGSGGDVVAAESRLRRKLAYSFGYFEQIRDHEKMHWIHDTFDDHAVVTNDANSTAFGRETDRFKEAVTNWATVHGGNDPMDRWRQLVNTGTDPLAQETYVKEGSSAAGTPGSSLARRARCVEIDMFVKGELTRLVRNWLLAIRLDLKNAKAVEYESTTQEWKGALASDVFPARG